MVNLFEIYTDVRSEICQLIKILFDESSYTFKLMIYRLIDELPECYNAHKQSHANYGGLRNGTTYIGNRKHI